MIVLLYIYSMYMYMYLFPHHEFVEELCAISGHKLGSQLHDIAAAVNTTQINTCKLMAAQIIIINRVYNTHLYHGWFSLTNHVAVLEVSISDIHLVVGVYLDRHLPLRLFAYMVQLCVFNCLTQNCK